MIIITTGKKYIDIDGYASSIAYRELLRMQGKKAKFISTATANYSVTKSLLKLSFRLDKHQIASSDEFIIIDLSNKSFFEDFVDENKIIELIDHHDGFEEYWKNILKEKAIIEPIGSVATIITEKYEQLNLLDKMDKDVAKLLMAAILDNTLNFTAKITKERDKVAYSKLEKISLDPEFKAKYFGEVQSIIEKDLNNAIVNDLKIEEIKGLPKALGQLTIYDMGLLKEKLEMIKEIMENHAEKWLINIICLKDKKSYIICSDEQVAHDIEKLFNKKANDNIVELETTILRKEIIKTALDNI